MPTGDELQWTELSNFSPGIYGDYHGGTGTSGRGSIPSNGAAVIDGTYRCCADASGALVPLPARQWSGSGVTLPGVLVTGSYPAANKAMYATDALAMSRFFNLDQPLQDAEAVAVSYQWWYDTSGTAVYRKRFLVRMFNKWNNTTKDLFYTKSAGEVPIWSGIGNISMTAARHNYSGTNYAQYLVWAVSNTDGLTGMQASGIVPTVEQSFTNFGTDTTNGWFYPDPSSDVWSWPSQVLPQNPTTAQAFLTTNFPDDIVGHQGRVVAAINSNQPFGAGTNLWYTDLVKYGNLPNKLGVTPIQAQYGEENVSGVAFVASMSADELLVMKHDGGGYLVRGDLSNPVVSRLASIESPHGVRVHPAATPVGLVYATRDGIFAWAGGDTSKKLSDQIQGMFFKHETDPANEKYQNGFRGRMAWFHPFVAVPNNYLLDTRTGGWWRLEDPTALAGVPYNIYTVIPSSGKLVAVPYKITNEQGVAYDQYDPEVLASSYSWRSQPMVESLDRVMSYQEIMLIASPGLNTTEQTVTVTLTGYDNTGAPLDPVETEFKFTGTGNSNPVVMRKKLVGNFQAMQVQVRIEASTDTGAAAKIHSVRFGHAGRQRIPQAR
jgi:hypothetical protein